MKKFYTVVVKGRGLLLVLFLMTAAICAGLMNLVSVNYDINDYLPQNAKSTTAMNKMEEEFGGGIPNARVMVQNVTIPEALDYKKQLKAVTGVTEVTWLDDAVDITTPQDAIDGRTMDTYYVDQNALFNVTIEEEERIAAVEEIRRIIGDENAMAGSAVSTATATVNTVAEIYRIAALAVLFVFLVLILTTNSWLEPFLVLGGLGVAILINNGSNLIFGEISFVTNAAGSILQLAVSLDYSVFLIHRFEECLQEEPDPKKAMVNALDKSTSSILSSGLTTVIGFLALVLMQFRLGSDLGTALAKGVAVSLATVFLFMPALILMTWKLMKKTKHRPFAPKFQKFGKTVKRISVFAAGIFAAVMIPAYLASNANTYYYGASNIYDERTKIGKDTALIEKTFGQKDTYVLMVPKGDTATETALSKELHTLPQVADIISYVDMAGAEVPPEYLEEAQLALFMGEHYSRMVISVDAAYEGDETFALVEKIREIAERYYPGAWYLAGEGVSTYDLMETVTDDMTKVNLVAIGAVFAVLLVTLKSLVLPVILVLNIETAIWLNLSCPYFADQRIFYIAYLIISSIQLGATVDYAILMTDRYKENRSRLSKRQAVVQTISDVTVSILTSGSVLTVVGFLLGALSTNQLLAQLGTFIGRGAVFSLVIVFMVLPGFLTAFDGLITKKKLKEEAKNDQK